MPLNANAYPLAVILFDTSNYFMDGLELTENPEILFQTDISATDVKVLGFKLFDNCSLLPIEIVESITLEKKPTGGTEFIQQDDKSWNYILNGQKLNFSFRDSFKSVLSNGGCLHLKNQISIAIEGGEIIGIWVYGSKHNLYPSIKKDQIEELFGKADEIKESYFQIDDSLASTTFIFRQRLLTLVFDDYSNIGIDALYLGSYPLSLDWIKNNR